MYIDVHLFITIKEIDSGIIMNDIRRMFISVFSDVMFFDIQCIDSYRNVWRLETVVDTKELNKLKLTKPELYQYVINNIHYAGKYESLDYYIEIKL